MGSFIYFVSTLSKKLEQPFLQFCCTPTMDKVDAYVQSLVIPWALGTCLTIEGQNSTWGSVYQWIYCHSTNTLSVYDTDEEGLRYKLFTGSPTEYRAKLETNLGILEPVECVLHAWIRMGCPPLGTQTHVDQYNYRISCQYRAQVATALFKEELLFRTEKRRALQGSAELLQKVLTNNTHLQSVETPQVVPLVH